MSVLCDSETHVTTVRVDTKELPTGDPVWVATEEATGRNVVSLVSAHSAAWHLGRKIAGPRRRIVEQVAIAQTALAQTYRLRIEA